jgi:DNA-binding NarL/FixJ family response regulator
VHNRERERILRRYQAHAEQFDELAARHRLGAEPSEQPAASCEPWEPTSRQLEVLQLIADGLNNAEIGQRLWLSEETIKTHLRSIYATLHVRSRAEAIAVAFRRGLLN